jgi:hypothetical protein
MNTRTVVPPPGTETGLEYPYLVTRARAHGLGDNGHRNRPSVSSACESGFAPG